MDFSDHSPDYYQILGCARESNVDQIMAEYKSRALILHPDKNDGDNAACDRFKLLQEAKEVLADSDMRQKYDKWLNSGLSIPFKKWLQLNNSGQMFHWVKTTVTRPMIDCERDSGEPSRVHMVDRNTCRHPESWKSETRNDLIRKFRDYDI